MQTADTPNMQKRTVITVKEFLRRRFPREARRFEKLAPDLREIARRGIIRHFNACKKSRVTPEESAVREIIDDAQDGRKFWDDDGKYI